MVPQTPSTSQHRRDEPLPDLSDTPVYTSDGYRLGRAVDVTVDLRAERATALLVAADETAFPRLDTGRNGVSVPYHRVEGIGDIVVVDVPGAAFRTGDASDYDSAELSDALERGAPKERAQ